MMPPVMVISPTPDYSSDGVSCRGLGIALMIAGALLTLR